MTTNTHLAHIEEEEMNLLEASSYLDQFEINDKYIAEAFLITQLQMDNCKTAKQLYDKYTVTIYKSKENQKVLKQMGTEIPNYAKSLEMNERTLERINESISLAGEIELK